MTDWEALRVLMLRARDGDGQAMGLPLTELSPKLRGYIRRHLLRCGQTNPADAEDLLQVTLIAIHGEQSFEAGLWCALAKEGDGGVGYCRPEAAPAAPQGLADSIGLQPDAWPATP